MTYPRSGYHSYDLFSGQSLPAPFSMGGITCLRLDDRSGQIGVQAPLEREQSPAYAESSVLSTPTGFFGHAGLGFGSSGFGIEGRSGACSRSSYPRVLWAPFRGSEILGGMETGFRPVGSESFPAGRSFQDGDGSLHKEFNQAQGLGDIPGLEGRIFSHSDSCGGPKVSEVCLERRNLSVQSTPLRSCPGPLAVHQDNSGVVSLGQESWHPSTSVPGRLAASGGDRGHLSPAHVDYDSKVPDAGVHSQLGEVRSYSEASLHLSRHEIRHSSLDSFPLSSTHSPPGGSSESSTVYGFGPSPSTGLPLGLNGVNGIASSTRTSPQETCSEVVHGGYRFSELEPGSSLGGPFTPHSVPMAQSVLAGSGRSHSPSTATRNSVHGLVNERMGCSHGLSGRVRSLGCFDGGTTHQPPRVGGCCYGLTGVCSGCQGEAHPFKHRQHNSSVLSEQTGRDPLTFPVSAGGGDPPLVSGQEDLSYCEIHSREVEHIGGCPQQVSHGSAHRVDYSSQGPDAGLEPLVSTGCRLICNQIQQTSSHLCVSRSRPTSVGSRCTESLLDPSSGLCLPSHPNSGKSPKEGKARASHANSGSSQVGGPAVVSRSARPESRSSTSLKSRSKRVSSASNRRSSQKPSSVKPSRMVSVRESLSARGASNEVIDLVQQAHRPGTKALYDARWSAWHNWCSSNDVNPIKPSRVQFANYLAFLASSKKLSASAVKGHRASISTTIKQMGGHGFSEDYLLKDVVRGVTLRDARSPKLFPAWDLRLVLESLRSDPYEPISTCKLESLTHKTVFLISLASARRCSEVHALKYDSITFEPDGSVSLKFLPGFLAKNQPLDTPSPPIVIKPLAPVLCPDDIDILLCPVRCLKRYVKRTKHLRSQLKRRLFVSPLEGKHSDITVSSISRWIKNVIKLAYIQSKASMPDDVRAHEVRAWASSLAWANNTSLKAIMEAAYWFGTPTFFHFYLRDVTHSRLDGSHGISVVAAQQVLKKQ